MYFPKEDDKPGTKMLYLNGRELPKDSPPIAADRTEQRDVSKQHPGIVSRLEAAWIGWAQRTYMDDWNGPDHTDWGQDIKPAAK